MALMKLSEYWQNELDVMPRFITDWPDPTTGAGKKIDFIHGALGGRPMPWQTLMYHCLGQKRDNGRPLWPFVVGSVPRQSGKTRGVQSVQVHKALTVPSAKIWYTADTGQKARDRWLETVEAVQKSVFAPITKIRKTNGAEELKFPPRGSQIRPHPPTADSLHSEQSDLNVIDEFWSFNEIEAKALMQAIQPTQATRPDRQTIIISTVGDAESVPLHELIDAAYAGDSGVFLLDYGIPSNADPTDLELVAAHHPAYGHTIDMAALEAGLAQLGPAGFGRAYGNVRSGARDTLVPAATWAACQTSEDMPADAPVFFGAAIDIDRQETAIAAAALVDGVPMIEVLDVRPGTTWATDRLATYLESVPRAQRTPYIDNVGPSSTLFADCARAGMDPQTPTARELSTACADLLDRIQHTDIDGQPAPRIRFRTHSALDNAMQVVDRRRLGDSWVWGRQQSHGSIAALEAATHALRGLTNQRPPARKPMIY